MPMLPVDGRRALDVLADDLAKWAKGVWRPAAKRACRDMNGSMIQPKPPVKTSCVPFSSLLFFYFLLSRTTNARNFAVLIRGT